VAILVTELPGGATTPLADQLARSSDTIHQNISEGCGYRSDRQLAKYLRQALGSTDEVQNDLETLHRRRLLTPDREHLLADVKVIAKKLWRFIDTVSADR
jgi:four helix bundle protein